MYLPNRNISSKEPVALLNICIKERQLLQFEVSQFLKRYINMSEPLPAVLAPDREFSYSSELFYRDIWRTLYCLGCGAGKARSTDSEIISQSC